MKKSNFGFCILGIAVVSFYIAFQPLKPRVQFYTGNMGDYSVIIQEERGLFSAPFGVILRGPAGTVIGSYTTRGECESIALSNPQRAFSSVDSAVQKEFLLLEQARHEIKNDAHRYP